MSDELILEGKKKILNQMRAADRKRDNATKFKPLFGGKAASTHTKNDKQRYIQQTELDWGWEDY